MARQSTINIKEDLEFLQNSYRKEKNHGIRARIKCLIYMKEKSLPSQLELSKHIGVDYATVKRWLKQYKEEYCKNTYFPVWFWLVQVRS